MLEDKYPEKTWVYAYKKCINAVVCYLTGDDGYVRCLFLILFVLLLFLSFQFLPLKCRWVPFKAQHK